MTNRIVLTASIFGLGLFAGNALGDAKSDAQAKVDAAKTEVCEKSKKFLSDQEAKGKCKAENDAAKKITCSAATQKEVSDLQNKCVTAKPTKSDDKAAGGDWKCVVTTINGKEANLTIDLELKVPALGESKCKLKATVLANKTTKDEAEKYCGDKSGGKVPVVYTWGTADKPKEFKHESVCPLKKKEKAPK